MWTNCVSGQDHSHPRRSDQGGQSLTEFALTVPLLLALLVGIVLLAWVGFSYVSITSAARMGARHMVSYPVEPENPDRFADADAEITYIVTSSMPYLNWQRAEINIEPEPTSRDVVNPNNPNEPNYVSVQVLYPIDLPTIRIPYVLTEGSFVFLRPIAIQATARMRLD